MVASSEVGVIVGGGDRVGVFVVFVNGSVERSRKVQRKRLEIFGSGDCA